MDILQVIGASLLLGVPTGIGLTLWWIMSFGCAYEDCKMSSCGCGK